MLAMRGDTDGRGRAGAAQLRADRTARRRLLAQPRALQPRRQPAGRRGLRGALESIEEAERVYRDAMGDGDEMEAWRAGVRAEALRGVGRLEEALELAEWASEVARERGMLWSLPLALQALGAGSRDGRAATAPCEALEKAAEIAERTGADDQPGSDRRGARERRSIAERATP